MSRLFESRVLVQWADVDIAGIMYFGAYQRAVERAEMDFFRELGFSYSEVFEKYDVWFPRVHVVADYFKPAKMEDWLTLRTTIYHVGTSSIKWKTEMHNERTGELGARLDLTVVCIDRKTLKSCPIPTDIRDALMACLDEVD